MLIINKIYHSGIHAATINLCDENNVDNSIYRSLPFIHSSDTCLNHLVCIYPVTCLFK